MTNPSGAVPAELLARMAGGPLLPEPLPADPFPLFKAWFDDAIAAKRVPNPNSMTLATIGESGVPRARVVLCRAIDLTNGFVLFYTNYNGAKGRELAANPAASATFHWDHSDRQVRIEGAVVKSPPEESDAYFRTRPWESRISAWASDQSEAVASRQALLDRLGGVIARLKLDPRTLLDQGNAAEIPRPPHWGGLRLWAARIELWLGGPGRLHDRAVWERTLHPDRGAFAPGPWRSTRLQP